MEYLCVSSRLVLLRVPNAFTNWPRHAITRRNFISRAPPVGHLGLSVTSATKHVALKSRVLTEPGGLQTSKSRLETFARPTFFPGGRMIVRCESSQFELYKKYTVTELVDDSPKIAQMMSPSTVLGAGGPQVNSANCLVTRNALLLITVLANPMIPLFSR